VANYGVVNSTNIATQNAVATTYTPLVVIAASTGSFVNAPTYTGLRRGKVYDLLVGTNGTPADNFVEWAVQRATANSSPAWVGSISSGSSLFALDGADAGFSAFVTVNASATSSALFATQQQQPWYVGVNQRASYRWVAAPGSEIVYPAVSSASAGGALLCQVRSGSYTGTATMTVLFQEQ